MQWYEEKDKAKNNGTRNTIYKTKDLATRISLKNKLRIIFITYLDVPDLSRMKNEIENRDFFGKHAVLKS